MSFKMIIKFVVPLAVIAAIFQNCSRAKFAVGEQSEMSQSSVSIGQSLTQNQDVGVISNVSKNSLDPIKLVFTKTVNGSEVKQFSEGDEILGRVNGLKYHNAEVCTEIIGKTDGACANEKSWEKLPNAKWFYENNEWRLKNRAANIGIGRYRIIFRNSESKDFSNIADISILQSPSVASQCVKNVGQVCDKPVSSYYYFKSEEMSISKCHDLSFRNTRKDLGICPQPSQGYKYAFQVCKAGIFDGTKEVKYRLYCAQAIAGATTGVIDCYGQCK